jgi:hypothetical protein
MWHKRGAYRILREDVGEIDHLEDLGVDETRILHWTFKCEMTRSGLD